MVSEQIRPQATLYPAPTHPSALAVPVGMGREHFHAMGTTVSVLLPTHQLTSGYEATRALFSEWEQTLSRFLPQSELAQLNDQAGTPVSVSPLLFRVLQTALRAAQETEGLFDPTLLTQLVQLGYDRTFDDVPPIQPASRQEPQAGGGWRGILLERRRRRVTLPQGVGLDVGGIAKGMAVDAALAQLQTLGIETALVNAGGDLAVLGLPPDKQDWPLAIAGKGQAWNIPFRYGALATSGIDRRHWQQGTQSRHHLIDPRSGESAQSGLWSVTVAANTCQHAEVAAKCAFFLGARQGANFLNDHGLAGLLVGSDGNWTSAGPWPVTLMQTVEVQQ